MSVPCNGQSDQIHTAYDYKTYGTLITLRLLSFNFITDTSTNLTLYYRYDSVTPVSYTHLDVYKRQRYERVVELFTLRERERDNII